MTTNPDFRDLFSALSAEDAEFLLVGGHAVMFYSVPRYTKDLGVWVRPSIDNAPRVHGALIEFGAPMSGLTIEDLAVEGTIFQIGVAPNRIDVITAIDGVAFDAAWSRRVPTTYGGVALHVISIDDLMVNKRTVGRPQDLLDLANLELVKRGKK
ncbi:MAG TPA: hypothetical protein VFZ65_19350 [Planctomycetota bacterium]|nr:hypothetical protein [Planctomycetota bacterium]